MYIEAGTTKNKLICDIFRQGLKLERNQTPVTGIEVSSGNVTISNSVIEGLKKANAWNASTANFSQSAREKKEMQVINNMQKKVALALEDGKIARVDYRINSDQEPKYYRYIHSQLELADAVSKLKIGLHGQYRSYLQSDIDYTHLQGFVIF